MPHTVVGHLASDTLRQTPCVRLNLYHVSPLPMWIWLGVVAGHCLHGSKVRLASLLSETGFGWLEDVEVWLQRFAKILESCLECTWRLKTGHGWPWQKGPWHGRMTWSHDMVTWHGHMTWSHGMTLRIITNCASPSAHHGCSHAWIFQWWCPSTWSPSTWRPSCWKSSRRTPSAPVHGLPVDELSDGAQTMVPGRHRSVQVPPLRKPATLRVGDAGGGLWIWDGRLQQAQAFFWANWISQGDPYLGFIQSRVFWLDCVGTMCQIHVIRRTWKKWKIIRRTHCNIFQFVGLHVFRLSFKKSRTGSCYKACVLMFQESWTHVSSMFQIILAFRCQRVSKNLGLMYQRIPDLCFKLP